MKKLLSIAAAWFALLSPAAAQAPEREFADPRIQSIPYDPNHVTLLRGTMGYQFMLQFDQGERIETVSIGDSQAWQVTPNRKANVLFLKPVLRSSTNLTVLTDQRRYAFELQVAPQKADFPILYIAQMVYPAPAEAVAVPLPPPPPESEPVAANSDYRMSGPEGPRPLRVFDDGHMTYFEWAAGQALPAIFAVSASGESLVNYVVRGRYVVVDEVAAAFVLRNGTDVVKIVNQAAKRARSGA
jgi:type IV secretion system protein VirB9